MTFKIVSPHRGSDSFGSGKYLAPRGKGRSHKGEDYLAPAGSLLISPIAGTVTKLGYPYGDDLSFRYVQVTDFRGYDVRFFYVHPTISLGDPIAIGRVLGEVQDLSKRYPGIPNHFHFEVKHEGKHINPNDYIEWYL